MYEYEYEMEAEDNPDMDMLPWLLVAGAAAVGAYWWWSRQQEAIDESGWVEEEELVLAAQGELPAESSVGQETVLAETQAVAAEAALSGQAAIRLAKSFMMKQGHMPQDFEWKTKVVDEGRKVQARRLTDGLKVRYLVTSNGDVQRLEVIKETD